MNSEVKLKGGICGCSTKILKYRLTDVVSSKPSVILGADSQKLEKLAFTLHNDSGVEIKSVSKKQHSYIEHHSGSFVDINTKRVGSRSQSLILMFF